MNGTINAVRGMRDVLPDEFLAQAAVAERLDRVLASYGYQPIALPIVEQRDLYLRKLGEELVGKVYEFSFHGRELALRPEWTASVLRAFVGQMQDRPLPLRLRYAGPVFRHEPIQRGTYRQFTQVGVELVGGPAPRADAECLALACAGLDAAGVAGYSVRIGHIGLIRTLLAHLGLAERTQGLLAWSLDRLRSQGPAAVRTLLDETRAEVPFDPALLEGLSDDQAEALLLHSLDAIGVSLSFGTRPPEAIVRRLVRKLRRADAPEPVERALDLLARLARIQGPPAEALPQAEALLAGLVPPDGPLAELRMLLDLARAHGVDEQHLLLDFSLGRGLHYYTGAIFEIYDAGGLPLCGGGRYDDLVTALGGSQPVPAVGFAYGLERVVAAAAVAPVARTTEALVVSADDASYPYALRVAQALRQRGYAAAADVHGRNAPAQARPGLITVLVGPEQQARNELLWRDPHGHGERTLRLEELPQAEF
ncbi:MAG: ATP phosphoribosyltransferase regulatory subunit [Roseiflexaceae bacterium]